MVGSWAAWDLRQDPLSQWFYSTVMRYYMSTIRLRRPVLKSVVMHNIPMSDIAAMERWYWRDHAPEINRRFGPWIARHESFLPVDAPPAARAYGFFNWRVTEGWWRALPLPGARGNLAFTVPPVWPRVATAFFPAQPSDDICGGGLQPGARPVLRWYCLSRYPEGVSELEGERWFLDVHARQLAASTAAYRIFSTRAHKEPVALPGEWPPGHSPPRESVLHHWDRLTELWFDSFDAWQGWIEQPAAAFTPPPWANSQRYPFVKLGSEFASSFLLERPSDEFSRDARGYL